MKSQKAKSKINRPKKSIKEVAVEKVLVVYNKPVYQQLILEDQNPYYQSLLKKKDPLLRRFTQKWQLVYEQHKRSLDGVERTLQLLGLKGKFVFRKSLQKKSRNHLDSYDLVITVGGDGTFLETSHYLTKPALLGVNAAPSESTGALCVARLETFLSVLVDYLRGEKQALLVPRLKVQVEKKVLSHFALNEVLLANRSPGGTSRYFLGLGRVGEEHKSSGVWVASGIGSTAAIRSAGGKRLAPNFSGMQYKVRELLKLPGQKFTLTQGVLNKKSSIKLVPTSRHMALFLDGNHFEIPLEYGEKVSVSPNGTPLRILL